MTDRPGHSTYHHGDLRAALLTAAEAELDACGVEGFSLRKVARRAGVSHAAPAHHFGDTNGLLTALAAQGYMRLIALQDARAQAMPDRPLLASGLGYVDFALQHNALFRLVFSSSRPDHTDPHLNTWADRAFGRLSGEVRDVTGPTPKFDPETMTQIAALWSITHGLADLLSSGRLKMLQGHPPEVRDAMVARVLHRAFPTRRAVEQAADQPEDSPNLAKK